MKNIEDSEPTVELRIMILKIINISISDLIDWSKNNELEKARREIEEIKRKIDELKRGAGTQPTPCKENSDLNNQSPPHPQNIPNISRAENLEGIPQNKPG